MKRKTAPIVMSLFIILCFPAPSIQASGGGAGFEKNTAVIVKTVGEEVALVLTARDRNGNVIRGWNTNGVDIILTARGSAANTDANPLTVAEIHDANHQALPSTGPDTWTLPKEKFIDGVCALFFMTTGADSMITIEATPGAPFGNNISEPMTFVPAAVENLLVELIPHKQPDTVFVMRRYELLVTPRDRYGNPNPDEEVPASFTARYPGEFTNTGQGSAGIFEGISFIKGTVNYFLSSTTARPDQEIIVFKADDPGVRGSTGIFSIRDHPPHPFRLIKPVDGDNMRMDYASQVFEFSWEKPLPPDPFTNVRIGGDYFTDSVTYKVVFSNMEGSPILSFASNDAGKENRLTMTAAQLLGMRYVAGVPGNYHDGDFLWHVEATDGLYVTRSSEQWKVNIYIEFLDVSILPVPAEFTLDQIYPNPFTSSTSISFSLEATSRVTIRILDMFGREVATLAGEKYEKGAHVIPFNARNLVPGFYICRLEVGKRSAFRKMVLVR
ncbi:MAG: T9SS type A sorting domain-containing protein [Chlorobi bacterium]|nr:T9SS type A sorting domain-containing protein [Chlorobiota bacterium]